MGFLYSGRMVGYPAIARAFAALLLVLGALTPGAVRAQADEPSADEVAEARRIFGEGLAHADRAEWRDAVTCFRQVMEIRESPPVRYNLGAALVHLGEYPEAEPLLQQVVDDSTADPAIVRRARESLAEMEELGGRVILRVTDLRESTLVYLDGSVLSRARLGIELPLSAGEHDLSIREGSTEVARRRIRVAAGDRADVVISLAMTHAAIDEADARHVDEHDARTEHTRIGSTLSPEERRRQRRRNPWLWTGVAFGAALIGGVVFATTWEQPVSAPREGDFADPVLRF